jgi:mRNA interferase RelE/StbE
MKKIAYSKQAIKTLKRIPANESDRIRSKIRQYAADPASMANNIKSCRAKTAFGSASVIGAFYSMKMAW